MPWNNGEPSLLIMRGTRTKAELNSSLVFLRFTPKKEIQREPDSFSFPSHQLHCFSKKQEWRWRDGHNLDNGTNSLRTPATSRSVGSLDRSNAANIDSR
jgi:hypothetical protein